MAMEEGLILPNFGELPDERSDLLPAGFRDEIGMAPPEASPPRIRTRFDPEGQGPRQGMTFGENFRGSFGGGTIEGSLAEAEQLRVSRGGMLTEAEGMNDPVGAGMEGLILPPSAEMTPERVDELRKAARAAVFDAIAYDLAPTSITPRSVAGSLAGQVMAPSNLLGIGGPIVAGKLAVFGAGRAVQTGASTAVAAGVTDVATQGVRLASGAQAEFDIPEAVLAPVVGGVLGAGAYVAGEAIGKGIGSVAEFVRNRRGQEAPGAAPSLASDLDLPREAGIPATARAPEPKGVVQGRVEPVELRGRPAENVPGLDRDPTAPVSRAEAEGAVVERAPGGIEKQGALWEGGRHPSLNSPEGVPLQRQGQSDGTVGESRLVGDPVAEVEVTQRGEGTTERPAGLQGDASSSSPVADSSLPAGEGRAELIGEPISNMGQHRVTVPGREVVEVMPVVVEARDLKVSSDAGYDARLQPRQRDRAASQEQIRDISSNLEPERLGMSAEADRGAPIVGDDAMVESGNGRVMALRQAYEQDGPAAARYREWLTKQGVDVAGYDQPVLVRQRLTDLTPEQRRGFADAANRPATLAMSAPERALADSRLITPDSLGLIRNANELGAAANRDFIRSFVQALPQAERGALANAEGGLSAEGLTRVRNAVLARAYGDAPVLARITEATADEIKSISNALTAAAPEWASMRADIEAGRVRPDVDLTAELVEAVTRTADLRGRGQKLDTYLQQQDAFDRLAEPVEALMRLFYDPAGRRAAGAQRISDALRAFASEARKVTPDEGLALGLPEVTTRDLLAVVARRGSNDDGNAQGLLYRRGARDGAGRADGRSEAQGSGPGESGRSAGRPGEGLSAAGQGGSREAALARLDAAIRTEAKSIGEELFRKKRPTSDEPDQIAKGRPVEDQGTDALPGDARPARLEEMAQQLAADFETVLRTGHVQPGARGQYGIKTGVARVRSLADLDTAAHEIGHSLQQAPQSRPAMDPVIARNMGELSPLGAGTGDVGDAEAFAELFRLYAVNRAYAERTYPGATADLDRTLRAQFPKQAEALDRLRAELDVIHRADSGAVVGSDVIALKPDSLFRRTLKLLGADFIGASEVDPRGTTYYAWRDALYTRMLDPAHPVGRSMEALGRVYRDNTGKGLDLLPQNDPYILARMNAQATSVAESAIQRGVRPAFGDEPVGPSFQGAVEAAIGKRWTEETWHDFGAYLTARRMVAEYERFAAGEIANPPGKLSAGDYTKAVDELGTKYPTFADGAAQLYEFQTNLLQRHFDKGLFSKEYLDASLARADYVPLTRDMADLGSAALTGGGAKRDGASVMKAFRGSQRSVVNPLDAIHKKVFDLEQAAALNDTKVALARLADMAGPGSGFIAERIPANKLSSVRVDVVDALRSAGSRANVDNLDLGALIHQAEGLLGDDVFAHIFRQEPIVAGREPITFFYENGERCALRLADGEFGAELHRALNVMTEPERSMFLSVLQISQGMLRAGVTKTVGFIYRNVVRDQFTSVATGSRTYIPFVSAFRGGLDVILKGGDFERYMSQGGFGGGAIHEAVEQSAFGKGAQGFKAKAALDPRRLMEKTAKFIELSEAATRAGLFQNYVKQGQDLGFDAFNSALYATFKANDYIDFRRVGSHMKALRRLIPFINATAQGTDKEFRALIGDMVRLEGKRARGEDLSRVELDNLKDSRAAWVKTLALGALMGGGTAYLNSDNPEWFGAAAWRRHRGYNVFPMGEGRWFTLPKPFGLVRNVSDLFEYATEYAVRRDPTIGKKLAEALADSHSVPYTNPIVDTVYNTRANYDPFRERPIVPVYLQNVPPPEQYTRFTSEIAKNIGHVTGWSPMKADYAAKNLGGGMVVDFLRNTDSLIRMMAGRSKDKATVIWDLPLARELVQNLAVGTEATTRFYGLVGKFTGSLERNANAYNAKIRAGDRTGAEAFFRNLPANDRAFVTLMRQGFSADEKLMHPLLLARAYSDIVNGVSRQLGDDNLVRESDLDRSNLTLSRRDAQPIKLAGPTAEKVRNELDALAMVTARNALIASGAEGMQGVPIKPPDEFLHRLGLLAPDVERELSARLKAKKLFDPDAVRERWPEVKARLLKDGENADLADLALRRPKRGRAARRTISDTGERRGTVANPFTDNEEATP